jgi:hypothetical protein
MITRRTTLLMLSLLSMVLNACGSSPAASTAVPADAISTSLVGTLVAAMFETQTALAPTATATPTTTPSPLPTPLLPTLGPPTSTIIYYTVAPFTPTPTFRPTVTGTVYTLTVNPDSLAFGCNNLEFVRDVTYPSGTKVKPGEDIGKTWKVANTGTCDWKYQYSIVLVGGDAMHGKSTKLARVVQAGHWAELTVQMGAPKAPGTYTGYWRLADADGNMFGATLEVSVKVK